jgi:hypothetical protein
VIGRVFVSDWARLGAYSWVIGALGVCVYKKKRYKEENILLLGLWVGKGHPPMNAFMRPLALQLKKLEEEGVELHDDVRHFHGRITILGFVLDLKGKVCLCMKQSHTYQ